MKTHLYTLRRSLFTRYLLAVCVLAAVVPFAAPAARVHAASFIVNTTADTSDANPGNGVCADATGSCSVRAAIEETNALPGMDNVAIPANTYLLAEQLVVEDSVWLQGDGPQATKLDGNNVTQVLKVRTTELLVCDSSNDSVASYDRHGNPNADFLKAGAGGLDTPTSLTVDFTMEANVFVSAASGIHQYGSAGQNKGLFVKPTHPGLLNDAVFDREAPSPYLYAVDYFPNNRIVVAHPDGAVSTLTGKPDDFTFFENLAFYDDDLYVTGSGSNRILRYDGAIGAVVATFANGSGLDTPRDLVVRNSKLFVANQGGDNVLRFDAVTGAFDGAFVPAGAGGLDAPTDLAFGPDGDLYVISSGSRNILRYDGDTGAFRGVFVRGGTHDLETPSCLQWRVGAGSGPSVAIGDLAIQNGRTTEVGGDTAGLDIDRGALVELAEVAVRNNFSRVLGGGIHNSGTLLMHRVEVRDNEVLDGGGGAMSTAGGIWNGGTLRISSSVIAGNVATRGGGISNQSQLDIVNSTISGNRSVGTGGGIRNVAGVANINASTITDNHVNESNSSNEPERKGGGIYNGGQAQLNLANSIVAGNYDGRSKYDGDYSPDCYTGASAPITSHRNNLVGVLNDSCKLSDVAYGDTRYEKLGTADVPLDPGLFALGYHGDWLMVHALKNTSPAVDGDRHTSGTAFFNCPSADQRGMPRPQGNYCDIGAFELGRGAGNALPGEER